MTKYATEQVARAFANLEHGDEFTAADLRAILDDHARLTAEGDALRTAAAEAVACWREGPDLETVDRAVKTLAKLLPAPTTGDTP